MSDTPDGQPDGGKLDELYHTLGGLQAWAHQQQADARSDLAEIEKLQGQLIAQRAAAAKAGERATYDRLSEELAMLSKAHAAASADPDEDPLDSYKWDGQDPSDDQPQPQEN